LGLFKLPRAINTTKVNDDEEKFKKRKSIHPRKSDLLNKIDKMGWNSRSFKRAQTITKNDKKTIDDVRASFNKQNK